MSDRQQALQLDIAQAAPILVSDPAILKHLLVELLNNACKYTPLDGKITVNVHAHLDVMKLMVSNTSAQIPTSELAHIFDKFYRIPKADPWKQGGTGLGLALVQKQTEHLGGTITVESNPGQLYFTVTLPLRERMSSL